VDVFFTTSGSGESLNSRGYIKTSQGMEQNERWDLITCDYDGITWVALSYDGHRYPFSPLFFQGYITSDRPADILRSLPTSSVTNVQSYSNAGTRETVQVERMGINKNEPTVTLDVDGDIRASGNVTENSDARIKAELIRVSGALDKVEVLNGYTYVRTDTPHDKTRNNGNAKGNKAAATESTDAPPERHMGLLAQEVLEVAPEVIEQDERTGMYSVAYGNLMGLVVEALKELRAGQRAQASEIAELRTLLSSAHEKEVSAEEHAKQTKATLEEHQRAIEELRTLMRGKG
jgi:hypothetical protein